MKKQNNTQTNKLKELIKLKANKGFALLIAVILTAAILTTGLSIVGSAVKEVALAHTARNSSKALYIADSGVECALYWDNIRGNPDEPVLFSVDGDHLIACNDSLLEVEVSTSGSNEKTANFWLREQLGQADSCARVVISKSDLGQTLAGDVLVESWGIDTCDHTHSRRTDRAMRAFYSGF